MIASTPDALTQAVLADLARIGQLTTPAHNTVVLTAGSLGLSARVCLMNNGGTTATTAASPPPPI